MGNLQADILGKQKEIEGHHNDLLAFYSDLGKTVAAIEMVTPLGFCDQEYKAFLEVEARHIEARQAYERLKLYVTQLEDRSRKIKQIEADIKALQIPQKKLFARLGAIAYEAYGAQTLADHLLEVCTPFFETHCQRTKNLEKAYAKTQQQAKSSLILVRGRARISAQVLAKLLEVQRRKVLPQFAKAGAALIAIGCEGDVPGLGTENLKSELKNFLRRQEELAEELAIHKNAVAKMKDQEVDSPHRQLEQSKSQFALQGKELDKMAALFGKALYETLPVDISSKAIGKVAISLIDQISLHLRRIDQLEHDILQLQNMIKIEELQAQIELDNQKVELLNAQIETSSRQISQVELSIENKRQKIALLMPKKVLDYHGE
ncbi:hypothetical protein [uncultured Sphaerochaeta sp.]|uniref:hypothetical protein n=1 Tax=uncultured Sphaerochaeta sp. TaxID=886478 RepID=UPI002A0A2C60|nr:hypothetical protein [uncultured Sphaerochaeta sp.]